MDAFAGPADPSVPGRAASGAAEASLRAIAHLDPDAWALANRRLTVKAISEFSHELLLAPEPDGTEGSWTRYRLDAPDGRTRYRFRARRLRLDSWLIDPASLVRQRDAGELAPDAAAFIAEFRRPLGIGAAMLPVYLDEITSILYPLLFTTMRLGASRRKLDATAACCGVGKARGIAGVFFTAL